MKSEIQQFIRENFRAATADYAVGLALTCEKNPDLTLTEVVELTKETGSTDEHFKNLDKAAKFLRKNSKKLGIKLD